MDATDRNEPEVAVVFRTPQDQEIHASAQLDFMPGGLRLDVHEVWGKDEHVVTLSRTGLRMSLSCQLFHLCALQESLAEYVRYLQQKRGYPVLVNPKNKNV